MKHHLARGALSGAAGSAALVAVLVLLGEPAIRSAVEIEEATAAAGETHEELFSRGTQVAGGAVGLVLFGVLAGLVFGVVHAATRHRLGAGPQWRRARRLGVLAFVAVHLVPFLKYPANPPAVGDPATVDQRAFAYGCLVVLSVLAVVLAAAVHGRLRSRAMPEHVAQPLAALTWFAVVVVAFLVLPASSEVVGVPADLVWSFRLASIGGQAAFWTVTATVFGLLCTRAVTHAAPVGAPDPPSVSKPAPPVT